MNVIVYVFALYVTVMSTSFAGIVPDTVGLSAV